MIKKAFTLVEMSLVLVIIGIIIGLSAGAFNIMSVMKLKTELIDIYDIQQGLTSYFNRFHTLPGDADGRGVLSLNNSDNATNILISKDFVSSQAFDFSYNSGYKWKFVRCITPNANNVYEMIASSTDTSKTRGNTCLVLTNTANKTATSNRVAAGYEAYYDDYNLNTGDARGNGCNLTNTKAEIQKGLDSDEICLQDKSPYGIKIW